MSSPSPGPGRLQAWIGPLVLIVVVAVGLVFSWPWLTQVLFSPERVRDELLATGPWAPALFLLLQALQVVVFAIPGEVTQIAGGWIFGFVQGSLLSIVGIALGSAAAFGLARGLGVRFVHRVAGPETVARFDRMMASPQFIGSLFLLLLIPGIPKDVLCYVAGLSRLKFWPFLLLGTVARLPGILGSSLMGKALFEGQWWLLGLVGLAAAALFGVGWLFRQTIFGWVERWAVERPRPEEPRA